MDRLTWMTMAIIAILALVGIMVVIGGPDILAQVIAGTTIDKCQDTDGGINFKVQGVMTSPTDSGEDVCLLGGKPVDVCQGRYCQLSEYYCGRSDTGFGVVGRNTITNCPVTASVCQKGACMEPGKVKMSYIPMSIG